MSSESANFIIVFDTLQYERLINTVLKKGVCHFRDTRKPGFLVTQFSLFFELTVERKYYYKLVTIRRNSEIPSLIFFCYRTPCLLQF